MCVTGKGELCQTNQESGEKTSILYMPPFEESIHGGSGCVIGGGGGGWGSSSMGWKAQNTHTLYVRSSDSITGIIGP